MKQGMWIKSGITMGCASFRGKVTLPRFSAVLFMMASLLLASCKQPVGGDPTPPTPIPETNRALLLALGITPDESPPTTAGGDLVSGVMNPLGKKRSNLFTQYELFQAGASFPGLSRYFALDVPANGTTNQFAVYATTEEGGAGAWLSLPKKSLAADLDGDGTDEIVTALFDGQNGTITFKISRATGTMQTKILSNLTWMGNFGQGYSGGREWHHDNYFMRDFTVGDFNNDGRPDFVLSCMKTVLILNSSLDIVGSFEVDDTQADDPYVRVEAGDLNGDDFDDLVVVNGRRKENNGQSRYYIFAGSLQGLGIGLNATVTNHAEIVTALAGKSTPLCSAEAIIADVDGNGLSEIVLCGIRSDGDGFDDDFFHIYGAGYAWLEVAMAVIDPFNETSGNWLVTYPADADHQFGTINSNGGAHPRNLYVPRMASGRFDGGTKDQFHVMDLIFSLNDSGEFEIWDKWKYTGWDSSGFHHLAYDLAWAADLTGDGCDELIYFRYQSGQLPWKNAAGAHYQWLNTMEGATVWGKTAEGAYADLKTWSFSSQNQHPSIAPANIDNDTVVVEYDRHEITFPDPKILAVLASPPYYPDIMEISGSQTSYTVTSAVSHTNSGNAGFYVSAGIGAGVSFGGNFGETLGFTVSASLETQFSWGWGESVETGTERTFTVDAGSDQVVFTGIPVDTYYYRVLNAPADFSVSPGESITINIPRKPQPGSVELSFYNSMVPEADRIPADLLQHRFGEPFSYHSLAQKNSLQSQPGADSWLFSDGTMPTAQGSAGTEIATWRDTVDIKSFDFSLTVGAAVEANLGYVSYTIGAGLVGGYSYEFNSGSGTAVGGSVGSFPNSQNWNAKKFNWGLMMIPESFGDQKFNLVTYWVE